MGAAGDKVEPESTRWKRVVPLVVLGAGLALTAGIWGIVTELEEQVAVGRIQQEAQQRKLALQKQLEITEENLFSLATFFASSDEVNREDFRSFVTPLLERHPAIRCLGFDPVVRHAERESFESRVRENGPANYRITERQPQGDLVPAGERPTYYPVQFIEPTEGNESALGFDIGSESKRLEALTRAQVTGRFAVTEPLTLVQGAEEQNHALLGIVPHFALHGDPGSPPRLEGFLVGVFETSALVRASLASFDGERMTVSIHDECTTGASRPLLIVGDGAGAEGDDQSMLIPFGGRAWRVVFRPTSAFREELRNWVPAATLVTGALISVLFAVLTWLLLRYVQRIEHLARIYHEELEQRQQAEADLRVSEERLGLTLEAVSDGAWDWDIARDHVDYSDTWLEALGCDAEELGSSIRDWEALLHEEDREQVRAAREAHLRGETPIFECENRLRTSTREYRPNLSRGKVVSRDAEGRPLRMVGTDTDISRRKYEEAERAALLSKMQQSQKLESLGVVVGGIAHDFNNLLVGIMGSAELAKQSSTEPETIREHLDRIELAGKRASELTKEMLAYAGRGSFAVSDTDLCALIEEMQQLLAASLSKKAVVDKQLESRGVWVHADAAQVRQVVMNLLINASDALAGEPGTITIRTGVKALDEAALNELLLGQDCKAGRYAFIEVRDTGPGMTPEVAERVFDPFFSTKDVGRGLGLAAVIGIVRWHAGAIQVDSTPGEGTRFRVFLPALEMKVTAARGSALKNSPHPWQSSGEVLVADDEDGVRQILVAVLKRCGFDIVEAKNGREALALFQARPESIRVAVLDMSMPHMSGIEAAEAMRRQRPDLPVVIASGYAQPADLESLPGARFVPKPFTLGSLVAALREVLESREGTLTPPDPSGPTRVESEITP